MIRDQLADVKKHIPAHVTLIAVSKTKPIEALQEAYDAGQRHFGENKVQEMAEKEAALPEDIQWHLIGHLQTNKVKYIAEFVHCIHSLDSLKLAQEINKQAKKHDRIINCLLQFHIAQEETKFGLDLQEATSMLAGEAFKSLENIRIIGVMGMASFVEDENQIRHEFQTLKAIFDTLKVQFFSNQSVFKEVSMGMSGDYLQAIQEGSTMVRVGSSIFGIR